MKKFCRKGHLKRSGKRWLALLMSVCLIGTMIPITARAENGSTETGLCEHHTEHTPECGYVAPARGHECEHVHDESCGYQEASECNHVHTEECGENGENCTHVHTSECGYAEGHACEHVHTSECGYVEASEGSPCTYVCDICGEEGKQGENIVSDENLTKQATDKHITTWQWIDEEEYLDPETGSLTLPGASEEMPAYFDDVTAFLPTQILATVVNADDSENPETGVEKTITLGDWSCDNFPEEGAYSGSYTFTATLPEGYSLPEEAEALTVLVELGGAQQWNVTGVSYRSCDENGTNWTTATCTDAAEVTNADTAWGTSASDTWYVVNGTMTIGSSSSKIRISVSGNVHLILTDGCSLTINGGIEVADGNSLTIYGQTGDTGSLLIQNVDEGKAGIGSASNIKCGSITINGGKVNAESGSNGAGIGSGSYGDSGTITINGGIVTATSYGYSAGIGGGELRSGGTITINGGTVTATGGRSGGAGIGGGDWGDGGTITINGGTITATGGKNGGAGIGGGRYAAGGNIAINGGTVTATGGNSGGAGIGGGAGGPSGVGGSGGTIIISGGTVTATGGTKGGAGIGGGGYSSGTGGSGGIITISGGTVTATGGTEGGAGIGDGINGSGGTVAISNSFVMAGSISDTGSQSSWNGLIFEGEVGKVYGESFTISTDCTIPEGKTLVVAADQTISITETATFTNAGTIYNSGTFIGTVANSGTIHNAGSISGASGGTIKHYSISIEQTETSCQSATLTLKVNDTAFEETVTYSLNEAEANAVIENGNTLKVADSGVGTPIPVTATFTVNDVSMTRTESVTITSRHVYDSNGFCTICNGYQPATKNTENCYEIGNAGQIYWFADKVNNDNSNFGSAKAVLTKDIVVNKNVLVNGELNTSESGSFRSWTPIGNDNNTYTGTFDGQGHTVSGLYFNNEDEKHVGLFGSIQSGSSIKKVGVLDSYFNGKNSVGGVCGLNQNGTIENCYSKSYVSGTENIGGVCGYNYSKSGTATIKNCHNEGKVSGSDYVGGVCGYNNDDPEGVATIEYCYNTGEVSSTYHVGGVCGWNRSVHGLSEIANCYNIGKVSGTNYVGGVCGYNYSNGGISDIRKCFNTGKVGGTGDSVGGVCGLNRQESGASATVTDCYYLAGCNTESTNFTCEEGTSKTAEEFASGWVCYLLNGSQSENPVWYQNIDRDGETADAYPVLNSNHGKVYQSTPCPIEYSNTLDKMVAHTFHVNENDNTKHICEKCGATEAHSTTNFTYSADEGKNRITVYCNEGGCGANIGYVELAAPSGTITYDGTKKEATVSDTVDGVDFSTTTAIAYKQGETTLTSEPVNAGTYTASITLGTGEGAATVSVEFTIAPATPTISWGMLSGSTWVEMTSMPVTYTGSEIAPNKLVPPTVTLVNGETYSGEISYSYRVQGSSDAFTSGLPTAIGTYEVKASIAADGNYKEAASTVKLIVNWLNTTAAAVLTDQKNATLSGDTWWAQSVTFTAPTGFTISNSVDGTYGTSFVYDTQTGTDGTEVTYYLKDTTSGEIAQKTATVRIDRTAPTWPADGGINIKNNRWKEFLNTISFGLFFKETLDVKASAADDLCGVAAYYYYVDETDSTTVLSFDELANKTFTEVEGSGKQTLTSLSSEGSYVVYAYAVDKAGNKSDYVCTSGVVLDTTAPTISDITTPSKAELTLTDTSAKISFTGSEAGTCFYMVKKSSETAPASITDFATEQTNDGFSTWTAKQDVSYAAMTADGSNTVILTGLNANTEYTLYLAAVDQAGNSIQTIASRTFTTCKTMPTVAAADMPKISGTYGQTVENMTLTPGTAKVGSTVITGAWTVTDSGKTDTPSVGTTNTYQVTFTPDNGMYDTVNVQVTPTVAQKVVTVTAENKTKTYGKNNPDLTFTVPEGALVGTDTEDDLGVTLSCEATAVSPVKEGGYAITGTSSSANYNVTVTPGTLTIEKADATITVGTTSYDKTFGDADFTLDVTDTNSEANVQYEVTTGTDVITVSNGTVTILKAGTATITVSLPASTNYNAADTKTITVTVAKKSGYTVADINRSYLYSRDNADTIDLSGYLPANCGKVTYGNPQTSGTVEYTVSPAVADGKLSYTVKLADSAGATGTITVQVTTDNYANFTITVDVKLIDQIPVSLKSGSSVTLQNSTLTYGQALSTLTFNSAVFVDDGGNVVTGTLAWKTPDEKPNAGTTSATWVFTPNDESYATLEDTVAITVNKATPQVTNLPTVAARTYNPTVSLTNDDLTGGTVNVSGSWSWQTANIIPTVNNNGYVAVFTPTDSTNYETVTKTITVTVTKATPYIATVPTADAITYGDTLGASTLSGGTVQYSSSDATTVAGSFAWKDSSVKPSVSDSNSMDYRVVFTPSDADNYNTVETDITLIVNKAGNAPNMPSSTMNVANSCEKVSDVTLPTGWVWQDADKNTELTVGTAVTATAEYNGADKGNYENETVSVSITRSACDHAHTEVRNAKEATCKETGYTGDTYCKDCGALLTTGTTIPLADHQGGTATCTQKAVCTVCGQEYGTLNANNHIHTEIRGAVAATCTAGGYNGDTYCTDCGVKTKTGTATPALGHNYTGKVTTEPTTEKEGVRTYTCDRCGHSYTESIPKLTEETHEHSYSGSVTKEATCTDTGVRTYTCSCGDSYTETIPAFGHHYVSSVTKQPTTSSEGVMTYTCDRCRHSYTKAIAKLQDTNNNNPGENQLDQPGDTKPGDTKPEDNKPAAENKPDAGKPYIKDENGKEGWDVIKDEVDKTKAGDTVTVEMNGSAVVPGNVLDEIKGKDVDIVFDMGNGITWSVNGQSITSDKIGDIDFSVKIGTTTIPTDVINNVTGERQSQQISLAYDGEFGLTAVLSINMEASNAGLYANLFYFNEKIGELEFICADEIAADGTAELTFIHASDYAIVIDKESMEGSVQIDSPASESQDTETESTQTGAEVSNDAWNPWWIIVIGIMVIVIGLGVFLVAKKNKSDDE